MYQQIITEFPSEARSGYENICDFRRKKRAHDAEKSGFHVEEKHNSPQRSVGGENIFYSGPKMDGSAPNIFIVKFFKASHIQKQHEKDLGAEYRAYI